MQGFVKDFIVTIRAIRKDKEELMKKDPSIERTYQIFFHTGFQLLILYRLSHLFYRYELRFLSFLIHYISKILYSADISPAAVIDPGVVIDHAIGVVIGSTTTVGSGTLIYHNVTLGARNIQKGKRHPDIGKNVLIGSGAKILGPVRIGDNARIGANSVVLDDVPNGATFVGIPARQVFENLEKIEWII
ncbi:serine acetyltransferase [Thermosipho melanesiensis]|uniref:Serine acetyltransferase n=2 Tax=Thermosipho melanesiensis TaxID=46541 RepID=A6LMD2_THEM4|nr:serine O-acetyltransferase EpsC [Thermosipho melanesiensis]ABR31083.1 Serine O-acetyltransferase [Thermosipho melanesiensis BI429]APT74178.1 serine acetyltransferase [Thermosipho melanesiensis]OOC36122.1 serine acetyltransferase [Thermosipho melanesiensis]OOC36939.1 serine acetyltransferase [Thermosipho melanesiensis]OOC37691.1 serine acetyltransferase [Thermosipho melanesiensis]